MEAPSTLFMNRAGKREMEMELNTSEVTGYLLFAAKQHIEPYTRAINCTRLAEHVARELECEHWLEDDSHWIWSVTYSAAEEIAYDLGLEPSIW